MEDCDKDLGNVNANGKRRGASEKPSEVKGDLNKEVIR